MTRWLGTFLLMIVVTGSSLHFHFFADSPWIRFLGELPGDLVIKKGKVLLYLPLTSSFLISVGLSLISSIFFKE